MSDILTTIWAAGLENYFFNKDFVGAGNIFLPEGRERRGGYVMAPGQWCCFCSSLSPSWAFCSAGEDRETYADVGLTFSLSSVWGMQSAERDIPAKVARVNMCVETGLYGCLSTPYLDEWDPSHHSRAVVTGCHTPRNVSTQVLLLWTFLCLFFYYFYFFIFCFPKFF